MRIELLSILLVLLSLSACNQKAAEEKSFPNYNILWISCEDMSPHLGCYGDEVAETPNLDKFAEEGVRFSNVFSVSGVCAPSRAALITGMYPTSFGAMHMRTLKRTSSIAKITDPELLAIPTYEAVPPEGVKCFTEYLRQKGYFCTNNSKTDYQFLPPLTAWDENSGKAHWKNRAPGQPFFAVFNLEVTHESQIWARANDSSFTDPAKIIVPPYYPDTEIVRKDLARMYDNIRLMDQQFAALLKEIEDAGLADSTIVFFYSDHGDGTPRAKRWLYDSGIKVPLLIRFPDGKGAGTVNDELISFVDFAPTMLAMNGIEIPAYMEGQSFLGKTDIAPRTYIYGAKDRMDPATDRARFVRDKQFKYIKNYEPEKPFVQWLPYRDQMTLMQELQRYNEAGKLDSVQGLWFRKTKPEEELYDTKNDPYEINNLVGKKEYNEKLEELRQAHLDWKKRYGDMGGIPEPELVKILWAPDGVQPSTEEVEFKVIGDSLYLSCPTGGASIAYQVSPENKQELSDHWKLYIGPLLLKPGESLSARANRIGYLPSEISRY